MRGATFILALLAAVLNATPAQDVFQNNYIIEHAIKKNDPALYEATVQVKHEAAGIQEALETPMPTLIYLTSESVPALHLMRLSKEAALIGVRVHPVLRGIDAKTGAMAASWRDALEAAAPGSRETIRRNTTEIRVSPQLFKELNATEVPVVVVATCKGERPFARHCELGTVARGETTLLAMAKARFGKDATAAMLFEKDLK